LTASAMSPLEKVVASSMPPPSVNSVRGGERVGGRLACEGPGTALVGGGLGVGLGGGRGGEDSEAAAE
jgi:hypothetical protein